MIPGFPALALIADTNVSVLALPDANFDVPPPKLGKPQQNQEFKVGDSTKIHSRFLSLILWTLVKRYYKNNAAFK